MFIGSKRFFLESWSAKTIRRGTLVEGWSFGKGWNPRKSWKEFYRLSGSWFILIDLLDSNILFLLLGFLWCPIRLYQRHSRMKEGEGHSGFLHSWSVQGYDWLGHYRSRGASTSEGYWLRKYSVWITCRGRTLVLLRSIPFYLVFIRGAGAFLIGSGILVNWTSSGYTHILFVWRYDFIYASYVYIHVMIPGYGFIY